MREMKPEGDKRASHLAVKKQCKNNVKETKAFITPRTTTKLGRLGLRFAQAYPEWVLGEAPRLTIVITMKIIMVRIRMKSAMYITVLYSEWGLGASPRLILNGGWATEWLSHFSLCYRGLCRTFGMLFSFSCMFSYRGLCCTYVHTSHPECDSREAGQGTYVHRGAWSPGSKPEGNKRASRLAEKQHKLMQKRLLKKQRLLSPLGPRPPQESLDANLAHGS